MDDVQERRNTGQKEREETVKEWERCTTMQYIAVRQS
jgi:hypothetical protein